MDWACGGEFGGSNGESQPSPVTNKDERTKLLQDQVSLR